MNLLAPAAEFVALWLDGTVEFSAIGKFLRDSMLDGGSGYTPDPLALSLGARTIFE